MPGLPYPAFRMMNAESGGGKPSPYGVRPCEHWGQSGRAVTALRRCGSSSGSAFAWRVRSVIILGKEGAMTQVPMDDARLKALFKTALVEVLEERKDLLRDAIEETLEDIALARAIEEGRRTGEVSRGEVFSVLEGGH